MRVTILHLFYDLLNLYGESGNILALQSALESQDVSVFIKNCSIEDELDLTDVDVIYMGAGTNNNQKIALEYLKKYKKEFSSAIENNKFFLLTGNSIELFGKQIHYLDETIEGLSIFDYYSTKKKERIVMECLLKMNEIDSSVIGFINCDGITENNTSPLFINQMGYILNNEGFHLNNFFATYCLGPLLARNPDLLELFCKRIIQAKQPDFVFNSFNLTLERLAYTKYIDEKKTSQND